MQKILIAVVVIVVVLGGGYYLMSMSSPSMEKVSTDSNAEENTEGGAKVQAEASTEPIVTLKNFAFSSAELRVKAGTKVVWKNEDLAGHSVTSDTGAFGSKILSQGKTFEHVFAEKGTFSYHCEPHPSMKGKVIVE